MRIGSRNMAHKWQALLSLWILALGRVDATADPRTETVFEYCLTTEYAIQQDLRPFLQNLAEDVLKKGKPYVADSQQASNGSSVYGLAECGADLNSGECKGCISVAVNSILNACHATGAVIRLRGCYLRYSARPFFFSTTWDAHYHAVCNVQNNTDPNFPSAVHHILADVTAAAEAGASGSANRSSVLPSSMRLYAFARCNIWNGHMAGEACGKCLSSAKTGLSFSCGQKNLGARIWSDDCFLRYETYDFLSMVQPTATSGRSRFLIIIIAAILVGAMVALGLVILLVWKSLRGFQWKCLRRDRDEEWQLLASTVNPKLLFKYETLSRATRKFHFKNRLGIGGFGSVYKGILPDGREIAVKRLFVTPAQGGLEFMNEVNIISSVQHRHLVKLVGCCIHGPESFLVYEFLSNRSLDKILFDEEKSHILDWQRRFDIILGTARGLAYLHEESQVRIVHRDVKASNVLLDHNFIAKISDFGLARLLGDDQSHITTGIAGTFGYIDPEYALNGHLTEKSDIFSFGVLCLEIVSGRRNLDMSSLVGKAWAVHQSGNASSIIDARVKGQTFREDEALLVIHVALLCAQRSPSLRPKMSEVILMLTNCSEGTRNLPRPSKPSFIGVVDVSGSEDMQNSLPLSSRLPQDKNFVEVSINGTRDSLS